MLTTRSCTWVVRVTFLEVITSVGASFLIMVLRNPKVPQNIIRGSKRNTGVNTYLFWYPANEILIYLEISWEFLSGSWKFRSNRCALTTASLKIFLNSLHRQRFLDGKKKFDRRRFDIVDIANYTEQLFTFFVMSRNICTASIQRRLTWQ